MACEYCHGEGWHHPRCPLYKEPKPAHYCSICDEGIYNGEEYVVNVDNEYIHYDCLTNLSYRAMVEWLGGEIKEMDDDYGEDY